MSQVDINPIDALRIPHHSFEVESSLLGAFLLNNAAISLIEGLIHPRDFYRFEHKTIFQAIQNLMAKSKPADGRKGCVEAQWRGRTLQIHRKDGRR